MLKSKTMFARVIFLTSLVSAVTLIWLHESGPGRVEAQSDTDLRLEMSFSQNRYVKHERIDFKFKLSNPTGDRIVLDGPRQFDPGIDFLVQRENGSEIRWKSKNYYGNMGYRVLISPNTIAPGQANEARYLIDEKFATRMFPQPGRYRVRTEYAYEDLSNGGRELRTILSDHINIEVEGLQGVNLLASNYLNNVIETERRNGNPDEMFLALRHFANNFRDSVYWKYVAYELGNILIEKEQYQAAEDVFYDISDIDFFHSKRVDAALSLVGGKLGRLTYRTRRDRTPRDIPIGRPVPSPNISVVPIPPIPPPVTIIMPNPRP